MQVSSRGIHLGKLQLRKYTTLKAATAAGVNNIYQLLSWGNISTIRLEDSLL